MSAAAGGGSTGHPPFEFETTDAVVRCPRCSTPGLLSALVPHEGRNRRGEAVRGSSVAVLCRVCDLDDPEAGALIAFFAVHGRITDATAGEAAPLIARWAATAKIKDLDQAALEAQNEQWLRGEL